jgi:hypothetical protein
MSIEGIILGHDRRGISGLRPQLPADFCDQAASLVPEEPGTAIIVTGFYILAAGAAETDGPPGAVVIGDALRAIGHNVVYVTDRYTAPLMSAIAGSDSEVIDFPIVDDESSKEYARGLLARLQPSLIVAIERCGLTSEGLYRNMRGNDITQYNAKIDHLFSDHPNTIGIGDGGNEIGLGNVASAVTTIPTLVKIPAVTTTTKLILASVSNWGGYGLVAAISERRGKNLLPSIEAERALMERTVDAGAVDGMSSKQEYKVDGFTLEENSQVLVELHEFLYRQGISA